MGIKRQISFLLFLVCILGYSQNAFTQLEAENSIIHKIDGNKYYLHTVKKGNTLYSLSKAYAIEISDIVSENPGVKDGLTINQIIKILVKHVDKKEFKSNQVGIEGNFITHLVKPQETLFSLKKKYGVGIESILKENPEASDGLKIGMTLKIPVIYDAKAPKISTKPAEPDSFIAHIIKPKETLYSLAKTYAVSIDTLIWVNHGLPNGLNVGQQLRIPKLTEEYDQKKKNRQAKMRYELLGKLAKHDTNMVKDTYNIAVFLPFYLDINDTIEVNKTEIDGEIVYSKATVAIDIYKGMMLAIDSIRGTKANFNIKIFDTANDSNKIIEIIYDTSFTDFDLVIGPLYKSNFLMVSERCKKFGIHQVSPVPLSNKILLGNPHVSKIVPSLPNHVQAITNYVLDTSDSAEVILINSYRVRDETLYNLAKREIEEFETLYYDSLYLDTINTLKLYEIDTNIINATFKDSGVYNIIVPSKDQVFVTELVVALMKKTDHCSINVYGIEPWENYDNLDINHLHKLNLHITKSFFTNESNPKVTNFYNQYFRRYATFPNVYGFTGFNATYFYLKALDHYGLYFPKKYDEFHSIYPDFGFDFYQTGIESGFENKFVTVVKYIDFQLVEQMK